jgi:hypothetical protein
VSSKRFDPLKPGAIAVAVQRKTVIEDDRGIPCDAIHAGQTVCIVIRIACPGMVEIYKIGLSASIIISIKSDLVEPLDGDLL